MKTSAIALAGLALIAGLGLAATGCKITHYGTEPPKTAAARPDKSCPAAETVEAAEVTKVARAEVAKEEACSPDACSSRSDAPCACDGNAAGNTSSNSTISKKRGRAHAKVPPPPPPIDCEGDADCPGDLVCDAGACR